MRDVIRITFLSKRWKYLWITIPCLEFYEHGKNSDQIRNFVSRALMLWRGTHLRKFSIKFYGGFDTSLYNEVDSWVLFAKERKVEELCISFYYDRSFYCPPQCLYECSSIRKLSLSCCNLQILGDVQWDRLNSLKLAACCIPEDAVSKVFSSSPQLETFTFKYYHRCQNLNIQSCSLKKLLICSSRSESSVMTINAPNLEALQFMGEPYGKYLLTDVSSLTEVCLDIWADELVEQALCQILPAIQHVSVRLSS